MSRSNHLLQRDGIYYYRRRVPDRLVASIGRRIIQFSLGTSDKTRANKLREVHDVKCSALFAKATSEIDSDTQASDNSPAQKLNALSRNQAARLAWEYFVRMDTKASESFKNDGPSTDKEREELKLQAEFELQSAESIDDPNGWQAAHWTAEKLLAEKNLSSFGSDQIENEFILLLRRAMSEVARRRLARLEAGYSPTYDTVFDPANPPYRWFTRLKIEGIALRQG